MSNNVNLNDINDFDNNDIRDFIDNEYLLQDFEEDINIEDNDLDNLDLDVIDEKDIELDINTNSNIDDDSDDMSENNSELDIYFRYGTNNHKLDGKHSLKRDTILKGKLSESNINTDDSDNQSNSLDFDIYDTGKIPFEKGSIFEEESRNAEYMANRKKLSEDVYNLLKDNTDLDFTSNRRKPNRITFNNYYKMLLNNIDKQYTKSEIFVELAFYFTDNIFNMYKLLDKKYATMIIMELRDKGYLNNLNSINFM